MRNARFGAELTPDFLGIGCRGGDVVGNVRLGIAMHLRPTVLMLLTDELARPVVVILSQIERIDASRAGMNQQIAQRPTQGIVASTNDERIAKV